MADRFCGNCGQELSPDDKFCTNCGTLMREAGVAAPPSQQQPQRTGGWSVGRVLLLVFVVPVLLALALFVFMFAWGFLNGLASS
jgi:uncharacterized membrane protein YvbJ